MNNDLSLKHLTRYGRFRYLRELKPLSRSSRKNPTPAENLFWNLALKNDKSGYRFLRQKPIGKFILDFYCSKILLAIEIDGSSHTNKKSLDFERDQFLLNLGIKTIRYTNKQIITRLQDVINDLKVEIKTREAEISPSSPPLSKRGKGEI